MLQILITCLVIFAIVYFGFSVHNSINRINTEIVLLHSIVDATINNNRQTKSQEDDFDYKISNPDDFKINRRTRKLKNLE